MPRTLSLPGMRSALAQTSSEVWVTLIEITHPSIVTPIRLCDNTVDTLSRVNASTGDTAQYTFTAYPFTITLPTDEAERDPRVTLIVPNINRLLIADIRAIQGGPLLRLWTVLASTPDIYEFGPARLKAMSAEYDAQSVQLTLGIDSFLGEPLPWATFSPEYFPAMFRSG